MEINDSQSRSRGPNFAWNDESVRLLVDLIIEHRRKNGKQPYNWKEIGVSFGRKSGKTVVKDVCRNKYEAMKKEYRAWNLLRNAETGLGLDANTRKITAANDWWERKIKEDPNCKKFRNKGMEADYEELLNNLFVGNVASRCLAMSPVMEPSQVQSSQPVSPGLDDDFSGERGSDGRFVLRPMGTMNEDGTSRGPNFAWNDESVRLLVDLLIEHRSKNGSKQPYNWKEIGVSFGTKSGKTVVKDVCRNKYEAMKKEYRAWNLLRNAETGLGLDANTRKITAPNDWWERKIKEDPNCKKFRNKGMEADYEELLNNLFVGNVASRRLAMSPVMEPSHVQSSQPVSPGLDDDFSGERGSDGRFVLRPMGTMNEHGTSRGPNFAWNNELVRLLVDLLIEHRSKNSSKQPYNWKEICVSFGTRSGKTVVKDVCRNKYEAMKKEYRAWNLLKNAETGLGFDANTRKITAANDWWERKIKEDPNCKKFRNKGMEADYEELLNNLFAGNVASGRLDISPGMEPSQFQSSQPVSHGLDDDFSGERGSDGRFSLSMGAMNEDGTSGHSQTGVTTGKPAMKRKRRQSVGYSKFEEHLAHMRQNSDKMVALLQEEVNLNNDVNVEVKKGLEVIASMVEQNMLEEGSSFWCFAVSLNKSKKNMLILLNLENNEERVQWLKWEFERALKNDINVRVNKSLEVIASMVEMNMLEKGSPIWCYAVSLNKSNKDMLIFLNMANNEQRIKWLKSEFERALNR